VDVVVPARDEEAAIQSCVTSLQSSTAEVVITVVDDDSSDGTAELAEGAGARVIRSTGPPAGWLGKPHACHLGATGSTADWLAFVDADVTLAPHTLAALVAHCEATGADAASPLLRQRCTALADRLLVPFAFWQYLVGLPGGAGRMVRRHPRAILNGQCIVVRGAVYRAAGGHGHPRVRHSVVEDSALACRLVECGRTVVLMDGADAGEVRMYQGLRSVRAGFGKNIGPFLAADPVRGAAVALAGVAMSSVGALALSAVRRPSPASIAGAVIAYSAGVAALAGSYRAAGEPARLALAHPVAAAAIQAIALESVVRSLLRRPLRWRGRALI
jgi:cellulose synthase/poly-beta-1,6-N-acetylglucosamine synthase-like glycosyltransferase